MVTFATALKLQGKIITNSIISGKYTHKYIAPFLIQKLIIHLDVSKIASSTTRVVLNGEQYTAHIKANGEFTL